MSVRHALLALLSEGPKYGLQLREEFEASTGEVWPLNVGQVYTTLQRLERDGLVETANGDTPASTTRWGTCQARRRRHSGLPRPARRSSTSGCGCRRTCATPPRDELVMKVLDRGHGCRAPTCTKSSRRTAATWSS